MSTISPAAAWAGGHDHFAVRLGTGVSRGVTLVRW